MRPTDDTPRPAVLKWLLNADPAIRWQVMRDLTDASPAAIAAERARVATEGWGAQLLARQSPDGTWPEGQWDLVTLWSLIVLKDLGLDPTSPQARTMIDRVQKHLVFKPLDNRPFLHGETEPCINGRILAIGAWLNQPNDPLAPQLLTEQLPDGGWNCEAPKSQRSSFHTTLCVLEGLLDNERAGRNSTTLTRARQRAETYLLERHLFRSLRTGNIIDKRWLRFAYPPFWHYDVLRALDYFRNAYPNPDDRILNPVQDAINVVRQRRHQNGRWPLNLLHPEHIPVQMETAAGSASRWNTLRALRVLRWHNNATT
ncbi:MAG: hypothetical protein ABR971_01280 [Acidobacteriaceae bacterium]|jgi:hypothetical protein